jgi:hypothetical protein
MSTTFLRESSASTLERVGKRWRAILAVPGEGSSGIYSEEVLREYGPKALAPGAKAFIGHDDLRSPKDMIGVYPDGAEYVDGVGLVGELDVFPHWAEFVEHVGPHAGLSIYMMGEVDAEGRVTELFPDKMNGVDLVSYPGLEGSGLVEKLYEEAKRKVSEYAKSDGCPAGEVRRNGECVKENLVEDMHDFVEQDLVRMDHGGGDVAYGQIAYVMTDGVFPFEGDPLAIPASMESPVALIRVWELVDGEWEPTPMLMGHLLSDLTKVSALGESKRSRKGTAAVQPQLTEKTKGNLMEKEEFEALFASLADQVAAKIAETLAPAETDSEEVVDMAAVAEAAVKADIPEAFRKEIYEASKTMTHSEAMALVESRKEVVDAIRKDLAPVAEKVAEGRVVEGGNVFSLAEIAKVAK